MDKKRYNCTTPLTSPRLCGHFGEHGTGYIEFTTEENLTKKILIEGLHITGVNAREFYGYDVTHLDGDSALKVRGGWLIEENNHVKDLYFEYD